MQTPSQWFGDRRRLDRRRCRILASAFTASGGSGSGLCGGHPLRAGVTIRNLQPYQHERVESATFDSGQPCQRRRARSLSAGCGGCCLGRQTATHLSNALGTGPDEGVREQNPLPGTAWKRVEPPSALKQPGRLGASHRTTELHSSPPTERSRPASGHAFPQVGSVHQATIP